MPFKGSYLNVYMFMGGLWWDLGYYPAIPLANKLKADLYTFPSKSGPNGQALATSLINSYSRPASIYPSPTLFQ